MWRHLSSLSVKIAADASRYRTRLKATSTHSDSANWPRDDVKIELKEDLPPKTGVMHQVAKPRWNGTLRLYFVV